MKKLAFLLLFPSLAFAQVQVQGKPGGAIQIGGNQPGVSSIQGATGDFTFTGDGFSGCSTAAGVTTCAFTGGGSAITLTTNGSSGLSQLATGTLNIPANHGGNVFQAVPFLALVGAFTDSSGNVIQPVALGKGPVSFSVPYGATQLQLGVNDVGYIDDSGSWVVTVNGTNYTVPGTTAPWLHTGGINSAYPTGAPSATSPVVATIGAEGTTVTVQYVSGTVGSTITGICGGGSFSVDAGGATGCSPDYDPVNTGFFPGFWTMPSQVAGSSSGVTSIDSQTGAFTFSGSGVSHIGNAYTFSGGTGSGTVSGQASGVIPLGTSATVIGNQSHLDDGVTTAATITSSEPFAISGSTHGITIPAGTAVSGATGKVVIASDATNGYLEANENNTGLSRVCTAANAATNTGCQAAASSVNVNGSPVSNPNFNGTTPSVAGSTGINNTYQVSSSSVSSYTPVATASTPGVIKPDGSSCTVTAGVLTCPGGTGATSIPICADSSGSGTAQSCSTSPTFTPTAGSVIAYTTTTSNSGTGLTINVNSLGAKSVAKYQTTTTLAANDIRSGVYVLMTYNGTNWAVDEIGNAPVSNVKYLDTPLDAVPGSPSALDDEFTNETSLPAKWTTQAIGGTGSNGFLNSQSFYTTNIGGSATNAYYEQAAPSAPWTITTKVRNLGGTGGFNQPGLLVSDGGGKSVVLWTYSTANQGSQVCASAAFPSSFCQTNVGGGSFTTANPWIYWRIVNDGTKLYYRYSLDGVVFNEILNESISAHLGTITNVGIVYGISSGNGTAEFYWFRKQ